ncbi:MAG: peptidyl-prolyl cis-trans isomerase D [Alphaproteobacteria bacterium]|jgi:peptidyl-prolyl cis-trans isomerase D
MLASLRKNVTGILAKVLIGLLILSFAVWGIGDMVRTYGTDVVANVGGTPIKSNDFRQAYYAQLNNISRQFRRRLTPQEAKTFGIEQQVLSRLTGTAAVDNHGKELNLDISDKAVEKGVYGDPLFRGVDGSFSALRLNEVLRQTGYSEKQFFDSRRRDTLRDHLTSSMLASVAPPKAMTDMLLTYQNEERVAKYIEIKPKNVTKIGTPTDADLKKTYETNKRRFIVPELRKFQALLLTSAAAKAKLEITDAELKTAYEEDKDAYAVAETRRIEQIPFKDEAAAIAAKAKLKSGAKFMDIAKAAGAKKSDIELGLLTKQALIDPSIAEAAFKLKKGEISEVVKGRFKTVLLRVPEIVAGKQRPFDDVKKQIRTQIENDRVSEKLQEMQNNIDDNRLAGKNLKEISEILKLPFLDVAEIDRKGYKADGKPALTSPDRNQLIRTAFAAEVGVENEVIQLSNDGYAWLNLIAVTPEKQKPFATVTEDVKKAWTEIETRTQLRKAADGFAKRVDNGVTLEAIAKELGLKVKTTPSFKRRDSVPDLPAPSISRVFALKLNQAAATSGSDDETRLVVQLTKISPPKPLTKETATALREEASRQLQADVLGQYVADLQKRMTVSVNQIAIDLTTGASVETPAYQ